MTLLRLTPTAPIWPYTDTQLRADEPGTLFPPVLTAADREPFGVIEPQPTNPPNHDPATHRIEEAHPALVDGTWLQQWQQVELTAEEQVAYQQANRPAPDWQAFKAAMLGSSTVNATLAAALPIAPLAVLALPVALQSAVGGQAGDFRAAWQQLCAAGALGDEVLAEVIAAATAANLPADVLAALSCDAS